MPYFLVCVMCAITIPYDMIHVYMQQMREYVSTQTLVTYDMIHVYMQQLIMVKCLKEQKT